MARDPRDLLPLKDLVFRVLVVLADGEQHGGSLAQALDEGDSRPDLPGHFYRTLDRMLTDGLIEERNHPTSTVAPRRPRGTSPTRYFRITSFGRDVARTETLRLEGLVATSRARLLKGRR